MELAKRCNRNPILKPADVKPSVNGAMLLDLDDPSKVIARSEEPIMEPIADYEQKGFFGNVVFTKGHVVDGHTLSLCYGTSDRVICAATLSISEILRGLRKPWH
jgi:predicted GH43/DUF377 family glycosyl hydrolase